MADILERLNITDDGILKAFYIIGFRYVGGSFAEFGDGNPEITTWSTEVFRRMDPARVARIKNLSGHSKQLFFELSGYEPIRYSNKEYYGELVKEFLYSLRTNGIGFALSRIGLYAQQKATERASWNRGWTSPSRRDRRRPRRPGPSRWRCLPRCPRPHTRRERGPSERSERFRSCRVQEAGALSRHISSGTGPGGGGVTSVLPCFICACLVSASSRRYSGHDL